MTKIFTINNLNIGEFIELLAEDKIVSFPTETIYALACSASSNSAIKKIFNLKQRSLNKALSVFPPSKEYIYRCAKVGPNAQKVIEQLMPGAITIVLNIDFNLCDISQKCSANGKIGFRIPDHEFCQNLLKIFNRPIIATSVNFSGQQNATNVQEFPDEMMEGISAIFDDGATSNQASTVIDFSNDTQFEILREGKISKKQILEILK